MLNSFRICHHRCPGEPHRSNLTNFFKAPQTFESFGAKFKSSIGFAITGSQLFLTGNARINDQPEDKWDHHKTYRDRALSTLGLVTITIRQDFFPTGCPSHIKARAFYEIALYISIYPPVISQEILLVKWQLDNQEKNTNKYVSINNKNLNGQLWQYGQN